MYISDYIFNRYISNAFQFMKKYWSILEINEKLAKTLKGDTKLSFQQTRRLREKIGGNTTINNG